ncbi:hypothetical protein GOODEAATRI_012075 [Goodea atripinnis]|uniref:Uncharacterized protein n=1 Tax=Goodea atripinnis TaxID=208336 RepID=A0ABV0NAZ5_9TELE
MFGFGKQRLQKPQANRHQARPQSMANTEAGQHQSTKASATRLEGHRQRCRAPNPAATSPSVGQSHNPVVLVTQHPHKVGKHPQALPTRQASPNCCHIKMFKLVKASSVLYK